MAKYKLQEMGDTQRNKLKKRRIMAGKVKIFASFATCFSEQEILEAYCLTVAKNLAIDRSQKKEAQNVELTPEMEEEPDANSPYDQMIHDERMNIINRLVNELPEKQRLIMQLRDIEGESYKKIAGLLNLTEEQVKVNLFRARQKVKQRYLEIDEYGL